MNTTPIRTSLPLRAVAAVFALAVTALGLDAVDGLARQRSVSPYAQVVELQRVVVTGHRLAAEAPHSLVLAELRCKAAARAATQGTC